MDRLEVEGRLRVAPVVLDLDHLRHEGAGVLAVLAPIVGLLDDRSRQLQQPRRLLAGDLVGVQPAGQALRRAVVLRELVFGVQGLHVLREYLGHVEGTGGGDLLLELGPVKGFLLFCRAAIPHADDTALHVGRHTEGAGGDEVRDLLGVQADRQVLPLRGSLEGAYHPALVYLVNVEAVLRALIVEGELVRAPAVIGRRVAGEALGLVDMPETAQGHARGVDGGRKDHHVLTGQEGAAVVRLAPADRVVGRQDGGDTPVKLRTQAQNDVVDKGGRVPVLGFLVRPRAEEAQPGFVEAGHGHDLDRAAAGGDRFHLWLGVDVQVLEVCRRLADDLEGAGVIMVHRPEQQHHRAAALADRPDELLQGVVDVIQGGVRPYAGPIEQVARDDRHVRLREKCLVIDGLHTPQGVQAAQILAVLGGPGQIAQVNVAGVQYLNHGLSPPHPLVSVPLHRQDRPPNSGRHQG